MHRLRRALYLAVWLGLSSTVLSQTRAETKAETRADTKGSLAPRFDPVSPDELIANAIQFRLTETGVLRVEEHGVDLAASFFPEGLDIEVPERCNGNPRVCCGVPAGHCTLRIDAEPRPNEPPSLDVVLRDDAPNMVEARLRVRAATLNAFPVEYDVVLTSIDCSVSLNTESSGAEAMNVVVSVEMSQDPVLGTTRLSLQNVDIEHFDDDDVRISGGVTCDLVDFFKGFFLDSIGEHVEKEARAAVAKQLCSECDVDVACSPHGVCEGAPGGTCQIDTGDAQHCKQEIGVNGHLAVAELVGSYVPPQSGIHLYGVAGDHAEVRNQGVSLGVLAAVAPSSSSTTAQCGPSQPAPPLDGGHLSLGTLDFFGDNARDGSSPFDVAVAIHKEFVQRAMWALYEAGGLCATVRHDDLDPLSTGYFATLFPWFSDFAHGQNMPMQLRLQPQSVPQVQFLPSAECGGRAEKRTICLFVAWPDVRLQLDVMLHERMVQLFSVQVATLAPLLLDVDNKGRLVVKPGEVDQQYLDVVAVSESPLVAQQWSQDFSNLLDGLLPAGVALLLTQLPAVALPDVRGLQPQLQPDGIVCLDDCRFVGAFAELPTTTTKGPARIAGCQGVGPRAPGALLVGTGLWLLAFAFARRRLRWRWHGRWLLAASLLAVCPHCGDCATGSAHVQSFATPGHDNAGQSLLTGLWSDVASRDGRVLLSSYESVNGDLLVFEPNDKDELVATVIDGRADGDRAQSGKGPDRGAYTSVALTSSGGVVAYQDLDTRSLRLAQEVTRGNWLTEPVESADGERLATGRYASVAADRSGIVGIAYMARFVPGDDGHLYAELRFAERAPPDSNGAPWRIDIIDRAQISCAGRCPVSTACLAATQACAPVDSPEQACGGACADGQICINAQCQAVLDGSENGDLVTLPQGTGLFASAAVLSDRRPVVAYHDRRAGGGGLLLAVRDAGGAWQRFEIDSHVDADVGQFVSIAISADDSVHLAYLDARAGRLLYRTFGPDGVVGPVEVVDDGRQPNAQRHPVGASAAIFLDAGGSPVIAYQDMASLQLLVARRNDQGMWHHLAPRASASDNDVTQATADGFFISASPSQDGGIWISDCIYDVSVAPTYHRVRLQHWPASDLEALLFAPDGR